MVGVNPTVTLCGLTRGLLTSVSLSLSFSERMRCCSLHSASCSSSSVNLTSQTPSPYRRKRPRKRATINSHASQKQRNKALTLAHAQTILYTSNQATPQGSLLGKVRAKRALRNATHRQPRTPHKACPLEQKQTSRTATDRQLHQSGLTNVPLSLKKKGITRKRATINSHASQRVHACTEEQPLQAYIKQSQLPIQFKQPLLTIYILSYLSISISISIYLGIYLSICMCVYMYIYTYIHIFRLYIYLYLYISIYIYIYTYIYTYRYRNI